MLKSSKTKPRKPSNNEQKINLALQSLYGVTISIARINNLALQTLNVCTDNNQQQQHKNVD